MSSLLHDVLRMEQQSSPDFRDSRDEAPTPLHQIMARDEREAPGCRKMSRAGVALTMTEILQRHHEAESAPTVSEDQVYRWVHGKAVLPAHLVPVWCQAVESTALLDELERRVGRVAEVVK